MSTQTAPLVQAFTTSLFAWLSQPDALCPAARETLRAAATLLLSVTEPATEASMTPVVGEDMVEPQSVHADPADEGFPEVAADLPGQALSASEPPVDPSALQSLAASFGSGAISPRIAAVHPRAHLAETTRVVAAPIRIQLSLLGRRAELAARACDWAMKRNERLAAGASFEEMKPAFDELIAEIEPLQPLYLWMLKRETHGVTSEHWTVLSGCYTNLARIVNLVNSYAEGAKAEQEHIRLFAESQSALCSALGNVDETDKIQQNAFEWCREEAARRGQFVDYLSLNQPADPGLWRGLRARIESVAERAGATRKREKSRKKSLNTVEYHARQIASDADGDHTHNWKRTDESIRQFFEAGGQPSEKELIDLIEPIADLVPEEYVERTDGIRRTFMYVDQRAAAKEQPPDETARERVITPDLRRARELLRGGRIVMIGGEARPPQRDSLERELELKELVWISSREHQSIESFLPEIVREDTTMVVLAIRWSSHSFEDVKETCTRYGKPFVRLPAGYGVNRVAFEVMRQQGESLCKATNGS